MCVFGANKSEFKWQNPTMATNLSSRRQKPVPGDEIVISGISGKFPNARNMAELSYNLYNKVGAERDTPHKYKYIY